MAHVRHEFAQTGLSVLPYLGVQNVLNRAGSTSGAPRSRDCVCSMAWSFHAVDARRSVTASARWRKTHAPRRRRDAHDDSQVSPAPFINCARGPDAREALVAKSARSAEPAAHAKGQKERPREGHARW